MIGFNYQPYIFLVVSYIIIEIKYGMYIVYKSVKQ